MAITRIEMVNSQPADPCCKSFVEPELVPPVHCDEVAKPLVGQFYGFTTSVKWEWQMNGRDKRTVCNDVRDTILVPSVRFVLIKQDSGCSVRDKTPVLHGTHGLRKRR